jgi:hypothetical protein
VPPPLPPAVAPVVRLAVPVAASVTDAPPSALAFNSKPDVVLAPPRRGGGPPVWVIALALLFAVGLAAGAVVAVNALLAHVDPNAGLPPDDVKVNAEQGNFTLTPPGPPWQVDRDVQLALPANVAMSRRGPSDTFAVFYRDYKDRLPRDAELLDEALTKLRARFSDLEYERKTGDPDAKLGGQPALLVEFQGEDRDNVTVNGQVLILAYRGWGYWFYTWGPLGQHDQVLPEWAELRKGFVLGSLREGWSEKPPKTRTARGKALPYKLEYIESVWEEIKPEDAAAYDKQADLVLLGHDPRDKEVQSAGQRATVQVLALDKAADLDAAVKLARDYLLEKEKDRQANGGDYNYPETTIDVAKDPNLHDADNDADLGGFRGRVQKLYVKNTESRVRYVVLGVVRTDEGVLAVVCECSWGRRDFWEQEFAPLLQKLRPAKPKGPAAS